MQNVCFLFLRKVTARPLVLTALPLWHIPSSVNASHSTLTSFLLCTFYSFRLFFFSFVGFFIPAVTAVLYCLISNIIAGSKTYIYFLRDNYRWPPLWSSGQSFWLQIQRSGFDSRHFQIFWEAAGLERGPLSLVRTTEELLEGKSSGSGLENRD
jgi:hypothetical protein